MEIMFKLFSQVWYLSITLVTLLKIIFLHIIILVSVWHMAKYISTAYHYNWIDMTHCFLKRVDNTIIIIDWKGHQPALSI